MHKHIFRLLDHELLEGRKLVSTLPITPRQEWPKNKQTNKLSQTKKQFQQIHWHYPSQAPTTDSRVDISILLSLKPLKTLPN